MQLQNLIIKSLCFAEVDVEDSEEIIGYLSKQLYQKGYVKEKFEQEVIKMKNVFLTALPTTGYKVAIPHTDSEYVNKSVIAIASLKNPVLFNVMGSPKEELPVNVVFLLAIKEKEKQVEIISQLIENIIKDDFLMEKLAKSRSVDEIFEIISEKILEKPIN